MSDVGAAHLDARGLPYRELNRQLYALAGAGASSITVRHVMGQRYLGTNLHSRIQLTLEGVPGQDLGAFMDGPQIVVHGNVQDGCGNTMNSGSIVIHGSAGDILGLSMRGGRILVRDSVGYRVGIHMKEYESVRPLIVIGGTAQHFLGEYMSGGVMVVLGRQLQPGEPHPTRYLGTGMHGGAIFVRGTVDPTFLGREVGQVPLTDQDQEMLEQVICEYAACFSFDAGALLQVPCIKLVPLTKRPYGQLYAY